MASIWGVNLKLHFSEHDKASVQIKETLQKKWPSSTLKDQCDLLVTVIVIHVVIFSDHYGALDCPINVMRQSFFPVYCNVKPSEIEDQVSDVEIKLALKRASLVYGGLEFDTKKSIRLADLARLAAVLEEEISLKEMTPKLYEMGATVFLPPGNEADEKTLLSLGYEKCEYKEGPLDDALDGWEACQWLQVSRVLRQDIDTIYVHLMIQPFVRKSEFTLYLKLHVANLVCVPKQKKDLLLTHITFTSEPCWANSKFLVPTINLNDNSEEIEYIRPLLCKGLVGIDWESNDHSGYPDLNHILEVEWALNKDMVENIQSNKDTVENIQLNLRSSLEYKMTTADLKRETSRSLAFSLNVKVPGDAFEDAFGANTSLQSNCNPCGNTIGIKLPVSDIYEQTSHCNIPVCIM